MERNSTLPTDLAIQTPNTRAVAPSIVLPAPLISASTMDCVWRRVVSSWVLYGKMDVQTPQGKMLGVRRCVQMVCISCQKHSVFGRGKLTYPVARDDFGGLKEVLAWNVQMCDYGSYCCREVDDRNNCCNNATAPKIRTNNLGAFQFETSTAGTSTTATAAAVSTLSPSSTTAPTQVVGTAVTTGVLFTAAPTVSSEETCASEKRKTAAVGGAVGGVLGAALVGALIAMFWLYKKEKHQRKLKEHYESQFEVSSAYWPRPQTVVVEAHSEMPGTPVEKEADEVVIGDGYRREHA
jgi:hypothetical protein